MRADSAVRACSVGRLPVWMIRLRSSSHGSALRPHPAAARVSLRRFHFVLPADQDAEMSKGGDPQRRPGDRRVRDQRAG